MKNNKKILLISAGLVLLGGYFIWKNFSQKNKVANNPTPTFPKKKTKKPTINQPSNDTSSTDDSTDNWDKLLGKGLIADEVGILQEALGGGLKVDNNFGDKTEARLKEVMGVTQTTLNKYNEFMFLNQDKFDITNSYKANQDQVQNE